MPAERIKHLNIEVNAQMWMGPGKHIVVYYVAGKRLVNVVANIEQSSWTGESWTDRGNVDDLRAAVANWDPYLQAIIATIRRRSFGGYSTGPHCRAGRSAASRYWETPVIRCSLIWRKARRRRSKMAWA